VEEISNDLCITPQAPAAKARSGFDVRLDCHDEAPAPSRRKSGTAEYSYEALMNELDEEPG